MRGVVDTLWRCASECVDERDETGSSGDGSGYVVLLIAIGLALTDEWDRKNNGEDRDGRVHQQTPAP